MITQIDPENAWQFILEHPQHTLLDVRDAVEFALVGHPLGAINIPWKTAPTWQINPDFLAQVERAVGHTSAPILLLCRSGQRSQEAALQLEAAGYSNLYNIQEGFEGPLDSNRHRSTLGGWRFYGLPWEQG